MKVFLDLILNFKGYFTKPIDYALLKFLCGLVMLIFIIPLIILISTRYNGFLILKIAFYSTKCNKWLIRISIFLIKIVLSKNV